MKLQGYSLDRVLKNIEQAVAAQDKEFAMESVSELIIRVLEGSNVSVQKDLSKVSLTPPPGMFDVETGMVLTFSGRLAQANDEKKVSTNLKMRLFDPDKLNGGSNDTQEQPPQPEAPKPEAPKPGDEVKRRKKDGVPF